MIYESLYGLKILHEEWDDFGQNLKNYIDDKLIELEDDSYDIILSFSRGGSLLAFAFACLLKDNKSNDCLNEYSNPFKASVRTIPRGFAVKMDYPCFVMDHPASRPEKDDITNNLEEDLKYFSLKFSERRPLNILILDDNLTGATRVQFLERELKRIKQTGLVKNYKTLAYVRHKAFLEDEIPTIRDFPNDIDIFVMPWHIPHGPKDLKVRDSRPDLVKLRIKIKLKCNLDLFLELVKTKCGYYEGFIVNGASNFFIKILETSPSHSIEGTPTLIEISPFLNKFYPPKMCLAEDFNSNEFEKMYDGRIYRPLCSYGVDDRTIGACAICSCLNCNKELIEKVLKAANSREISITTEFRKEINSNLIHAIEKWFEESIAHESMM